MSAKPKNGRVISWIGRVLSALVGLALVASAAMKFRQSDDAVKGFKSLGWPASYAVGIGILELSCAVIYLFPRTAVLGAVLIAGYMGGAIATHLRLGQAVPIQVTIGVLAWLGVYLREPRLRAVLPLRR